MTRCRVSIVGMRFMICFEQNSNTLHAICVSLTGQTGINRYQILTDVNGSYLIGGSFVCDIQKVQHITYNIQYPTRLCRHRRPVNSYSAVGTLHHRVDIPQDALLSRTKLRITDQTMYALRGCRFEGRAQGQPCWPG